MKKNESRIESLLVVLLLNNMKNASIAERAIQLNLAGFSNIEIADFLETSPQVVANAVSQKHKKRKK